MRPVWQCGRLAVNDNGVEDWTEHQEGLWKTERGVMELKAGARRVRSLTMTEYTQRTRRIAQSAATINNTRVSLIHITRCAVPARCRPSTTHTAVCRCASTGMGRRRVAVVPGRSGGYGGGGAIGRWWCCCCGGRWCRRVGGGDATAASTASGEKGLAAGWRRPPRASAEGDGFGAPRR